MIVYLGPLSCINSFLSNINLAYGKITNFDLVISHNQHGCSCKRQRQN